MTDTYTHVMKMSAPDRTRWLANALTYGLACTCKGNYCAMHDPRMIALLKDARNEPAVKVYLGEIEDMKVERR